MKYLVRTTIYVILLLAGVSCADIVPDCVIVPEEDEDQKLEFAAVNIENVLLQQVLLGHQCTAVYDDSVKYTIKENEILALGDVLAEKLTKMGLEINPELFKDQLRKTHGVTADKVCYYSLDSKRMELYINPGMYKPEPIYEFNVDLTESRSRYIEEVVIDPRVGLMYPIMFLPEIVDYANEYPEIRKAESVVKMPKVNGERVKKWKDEKYALQQHENIMMVVYHINNYILYENRESLAWLVANCMPVLQAMFVDFHMEHDPMIDSLVLIRTRSGEARIEALFAERNADGSVYVREGLLEYISQNERLKAPRFQTTIRQYVAGCLGHDIYCDRTERFPKVLVDNFTLDERRMIVARIMNVVFSLYSSNDYDKIMKIIVEHDPGFIDDAVKKNYYGFENLRTGLSLYRMRFRAEKWKILSPAK